MEGRASGQCVRKTLPTDPTPVLIVLLTAAFCVEFVLAYVCLTGPNFGSDFAEFWAASRLGLAGRAAEIYHGATLVEMERIATPVLRDGTPWFYPPTFYLVVLPLSLLPYKVAYLAFEGATLGCFLAVFRRITRNRTAMWCAAAFPGVWINFLYGQNGFLTAALAGAALLCLRRRPLLAGALAGLLTIKPHLALVFPVALVAMGAWRALASATVTTAAFAAVSVQVMGFAAWRQTFAELGYARALLEDGVGQERMPTVFSFVRMLGGSLRVAYGVHALVALCAIAAVWRVWRSCDDWRLRGAVLMVGTLMVSPYMQVYDLAWLAFPIVWMVLAGVGDRWVERGFLAAAWVLPLVMAVGGRLHLQAGPWVLGGLMCVAVRRAMMAGALEVGGGPTHGQRQPWVGHPAFGSE